MDTITDFALVFVPLFVAMDPPGNLAFVVSLLGRVPEERHGRVIRIALVTGLIIGLAFLGLGRAIFEVIGITDDDFVIAGGLILLVISLRELIGHPGQAEPEPNELLAIVPIGTPLLVGPATVSMLILLTGMYPIWMVLAAFLLNLLIAWLLFSQARRIVQFLGRGGLEAFAKAMYLLLAAIAVQLIREGITSILRSL